ncbi:uncharacterized protein A1O5_11772 [Cladophialophora psammophila CBS 110553]|uniref:Uncharacterized protein n=1 Tax=Cladophialophora psammophila CBS 110553 TaxID=1182543 RepID=W9WA98_9EURO|nr:uncharacterized protein A1O5_11772 [Cladophialophora psammophila CBS 110553]EXJ61456.1 hypothetical protein A1O5_11772 [Cladophialophora psammophila CBS 110553]
MSLRSQGKIPKGVKFQVSLPTPAEHNCLRRRGYQSTVDPFYEAALLRALSNIPNATPPSDLAIQWDAPTKFAKLEGTVWPHFSPWFPKQAVVDKLVERMMRLLDSVREDVECRLHLCYGDLGHGHFIEPTEMGFMVEIANGVKKGSKRRINWIHMPVPKERLHDDDDDDADAAAAGCAALALLDFPSRTRVVPGRCTL